MSFDPVTAVIDLGSKVLDRVLPDKTANDAAKAQLLQSQVSGEIASIIAQAQIDTVEAASGSTFVAGWRPFVGWVCGSAFAYSYIFQPFLKCIAVLFHNHFDPTVFPVVDTSEMMPVLLGMLGLAGARTLEKIQGVNAGH